MGKDFIKIQPDRNQDINMKKQNKLSNRKIMFVPKEREEKRKEKKRAWFISVCWILQ